MIIEFYPQNYGYCLIRLKHTHTHTHTHTKFNISSLTAFWELAGIRLANP